DDPVALLPVDPRRGDVHLAAAEVDLRAAAGADVRHPVGLSLVVPEVGGAPGALGHEPQRHRVLLPRAPARGGDVHALAFGYPVGVCHGSPPRGDTSLYAAVATEVQPGPVAALASPRVLRYQRRDG